MTQKMIDRLIEMGASEWEKGANHRLPNQRKEENTMKTKVTYQYGESRLTPGKAVDFMLAMIIGESEDIELYVETDPISSGEDEALAYDDLKDAILEQAVEHGIDPDTLEFFYD